MTEEIPLSYARAVGERLRSVRRQQKLSLLAVEEASGREFKASVLGAYERGERIISVLRMQRLAQIYGVPVDQLLPRTSTAGPGVQEGGGRGDGPDDSRGPVTIDLVQLAALDTPEKEVLRRYMGMIQVQRGDFNGRVLTIRAEDVNALGRVLELDESRMRVLLSQLGLTGRSASHQRGLGITN